jgi:hypothetical protein
MAVLAITQALDNLLPSVLYELIIDYYGIKDNIESNCTSMCVYNDILYVLYGRYVITYDNDFNEIKKYNTCPLMIDLSVDDKHIYTISIGYGALMEKHIKETGEDCSFDQYGGCITLHNNKLYIKPCDDTKINIVCPIAGTLLETINTNVYSGCYRQRCKIMFRENELFITRDYKFLDVENLITINNNYDVYTNGNKICLYKKNTLYKKDNKINIPIDDDLISKLNPIDEIIVDARSFRNDNQELKIDDPKYTIKCITAIDDKIYTCIDYTKGSKIIVYNIHKNKINRKRKRN